MTKRIILSAACWLWVALWGSVGLLWMASVALPPSRLEALYYALFGIGIDFGYRTLPEGAQWVALVLSDAAVAAAACLAAYVVALGAGADKAWPRRSLALAALWAAAFIWAFRFEMDYSDPSDTAGHLLLGGTLSFAAVGAGLALLRRLGTRARGTQGTAETL